MPDPIVTIQASFGNGQTLDALSDIIRIRERYFKDTAKQSVKAIAITVMKSLRAATSMAKLQRNEIEVASTSFKPSVHIEGKRKMPCLRFGKARYQPQKGQVVVWTDDCMGVKMGALTVYWFDLKYSKVKRTYLIVAPSQSSANRKARDILTRRMNRYRGLARRAITLLMVKAAIGNEQDDVGRLANQKAQENTFATVFDNDKSYSLLLEDTLDYAQNAVKGGPNAMETALQKALNKAVGTVNHRFSSSQNAFYTNQRLDIPFPESRQKG